MADESRATNPQQQRRIDVMKHQVTAAIDKRTTWSEQDSLTFLRRINIAIRALSDDVDEETIFVGEEEFERYLPVTSSDRPMLDDLTDAKIAASEARTETKFAQLEGKLDTKFASIDGKLDALSKSIGEQRTEANANRTAVVTTVLGVGFALAALLLAVMAYGDSVFSRGMSVRDVVDAAVHDAIKAKAP